MKRNEKVLGYGTPRNFGELYRMESIKKHIWQYTEVKEAVDEEKYIWEQNHCTKKRKINLLYNAQE